MDIRLEVVFNKSVYALGIETARELLAGLERAADLPPAAETLRADLRREIARHDAGPDAAAEESDGADKSDASDRSDAPRCWACDRPGRRLPYDWRRGEMYVCGTPGCVRCGIPTAPGEFENGCN